MAVLLVIPFYAMCGRAALCELLTPNGVRMTQKKNARRRRSPAGQPSGALQPAFRGSPLQGRYIIISRICLVNG
jgi:hypothetical protein